MESSGGIPDFQADAAVLAEYEAAKQRYVQTEISQAESAVRAQHSRKRTNVLGEIAAARETLEARRRSAELAVKEYAAISPRRVRGNQIEHPSFFESLFSFGRATRAYRNAVHAAEELVQAQATYRRRQRWEDELESWLKRSLHRVSVEQKQRADTPEWLEKFNASPDVAELWKKVQAIRNERDEYAKRVQSGAVSPIEQRDRYLFENAIGPLRPPFEGVMIEEIRQFAELCCWIFRDLQGNKYWLPYDRRLEPLSDSVIDTFRLVDDIKAKFNRTEDGRRFTPLDHYLRRIADESDARATWRKRTATLRTAKDTAKESPIDDADDRQVLDLLAGLATTAPRHAEYSG